MEKETLKEELKKLKAIKDVAHLDGVVLLKDHAKRAVLNCINIFANGYADKNEQELRSIGATLKANLELYQLLTGIDEQIDAIEEAVKES